MSKVEPLLQPLIHEALLKSPTAGFANGMARKCVHKGCGKSYTNIDEDCVFHPGPPIFHEGQKGVCAPVTSKLHVHELTLKIGWNCCKPRVLTFDEFLSIPPCTTGKHSTIDDTPKPEQRQELESEPPAPKPVAIPQNATLKAFPAPRLPHAPQPPASTTPPTPESDSDDPSLQIPPNVTCRRKACNITSPNINDVPFREKEECIYHPGQALFHEGSKGWTCCKRRVLEFDEFMKIEGCKRKSKHLFVGRGKAHGVEEALLDVRCVKQSHFLWRFFIILVGLSVNLTFPGMTFIRQYQLLLQVTTSRRLTRSELVLASLHQPRFR